MKIVAQIDVFVTSLNDMVGVFSGDYDAGDFCKGLLFGKDGSQMLYNIALAFVDDEPQEDTKEGKKIKAMAMREKAERVKKEGYNLNSYEE